MKEKVKTILLCVHPVLLYASLCPAGYMFLQDREDRYVVPLWLGGAVLLLVSFTCRIAVRSCRHLGTYLLETGLSFACTMMLANVYQDHFLPDLLGIAYMIVTGTACFLISFECVAIRLREAGRKKAIEENDVTWSEQEHMLEKPRPVFVLLFVIIYLAGAFYAGCPAACDLAMISAALYLLLAVAFEGLYETDRYLDGTRDVKNVPVGKIRSMRRGMLLLVVMALTAVSLLSILLGRERIYHDARGWYSMRSLRTEWDWEEMPDMGEFEFMENGVWEEFGPHEPREVPPWVNTLGEIVGALCGLLFFTMIMRTIYEHFLAFREGFEENGDVADPLDEPDEVFRLEKEKKLPLVGGTERDRIRRQYIRTIRRYRKERVLDPETPAQIEGKAQFPENLDTEELHRTYEEARYSDSPY